MNENKYYRVYSEYLKKIYHKKVYKLPVNLPITCPNRLLAAGRKGCAFCAEVGTGFEAMILASSAEEELEATQKRRFNASIKQKNSLAHFQNLQEYFYVIEPIRNIYAGSIIFSGYCGTFYFYQTGLYS